MSWRDRIRELGRQTVGVASEVAGATVDLLNAELADFRETTREARAARAARETAAHEAVSKAGSDAPPPTGAPGMGATASPSAHTDAGGLLPAEIPIGPPVEDPKALYWDPFSLVEQLGYKEKPTAITYGTLAAMVWKVPIIGAIIQTRVNQVSAFASPQRHRFETGFRIKLRDQEAKPTRSDKLRMRELEELILTTGYTDDPRGRDSFDTFIRKIVRDSLTYDALTFEIVPGRNGKPSQWYAVDAATIRLADTYRLYPDADTDRVKYVQIYDQVVISEFTDKELAFAIRNPRTDIRGQGYGTSEAEMMVSTITQILWGLQYNANFFSQGTVSKGLINLKGPIPEKQLRAFRRQWYQMISGVENAWRTPVLNAEEVQWIDMQRCVAGDTAIWTANGQTTVEDVLAGRSEVETTVWTGEKWSSALVYKTKGTKRRCVTTLGDGSRLTTSPDHRFLAFDSAGELVWREQQELREGDFVAMNARAYDTGARLTLNGREVGPDLMEILGWATCDGTFDFGGRGAGRINRVRLFYNHARELDVRARHLSILQSYGLAAVAETQSVPPRADCVSATDTLYLIRLDSVDFVEWLEALGCASTAAGKVIPAGVFGLPRAHRAAFLRGVFSANGSSHDRRNPILSSRSAEIRAGVRRLLLTLGIRCSPSEGKVIKNPWTGECREGRSYLKIKDRDRFFADVGFCAELRHKQPRATPDRAGCTDAVPESVYLRLLAQVRAADKASGLSLLTALDRKRLCEIFGGRSRCSKTRLLEFMQKTQVEAPAWLTAYHFEPIVDIERTDEQIVMYDLTVYDDAHQFVANGFITHNSNRDMEFSAWIDFLIKVACAIYSMDPIEVNFKYGSGGGAKSMFDSANKSKLIESKDRGLKPLLRFLARTIDRHILWPLDPKFSFEFVGLDAQTPKEIADLNTQRVRSMYMVDEIRAENDLAPLPNGEGQVILDANWLAMKRFKEEQELQAAQQAAQLAMAGSMAAAPGVGGAPGAGGAADPTLGGKLDGVTGNHGKPPNPATDKQKKELEALMHPTTKDKSLRDRGERLVKSASASASASDARVVLDVEL
jgi:intein/homing endonuclease